MKKLTSLAAMLALGISPVAAQEWRGVDLSYVNEVEDCGAIFRTTDGEERDPFVLFSEAGANIVRLRLWHSPDWTEYSTLTDVKRSIRRAHDAGMKVLLDFHYSDDWADPGDQLIPAAWADIKTDEELAQTLYEYTYETLAELAEEDLWPAYVQVGNETNTEILMAERIAETTAIDWTRNAPFFKAGLKAVRDVARDKEASIGVMLHIAQPENIVPWFDAALANGVDDFDIIGLSYYAKWSSTSFEDLSATLEEIRTRYNKDIVVVETAYPFTMEGSDEAGNILGEDSLIEGYPASVEGQRRYLLDLEQRVVAAGGLGIVYWEPAWVSSSCETRWGKGSHWENATLFELGTHKLHAGAEYLKDE